MARRAMTDLTGSHRKAFLVESKLVFMFRFTSEVDVNVVLPDWQSRVGPGRGGGVGSTARAWARYPSVCTKVEPPARGC